MCVLKPNHPDVIIVGAGITGCVTALALAGIWRKGRSD